MHLAEIFSSSTQCLVAGAGRPRMRAGVCRHRGWLLPQHECSGQEICLDGRFSEHYRVVDIVRSV